MPPGRTTIPSTLSSGAFRSSDVEGQVVGHTYVEILAGGMCGSGEGL